MGNNKMAKYMLYFRKVHRDFVEVEANDTYEAWDLADEIIANGDLGDGFGDWECTDVEKVPE
jgi:hypothetical protein